MTHRDVNRSLTGRIGRVTGRIGPGTIGEVMLPFRGGTSAFHAHPYDTDRVFGVGDQVLVIYFKPPQTVYVDEIPEILRTDDGGVRAP
ncbi:hypothetical protein [Arthrobacter oryzae]|uniref:hypothetical protein n=1 Tax=Arthrobacter oryzae TaxID=409290 RepID=UPI001C8356B6|nr:hypothetical protein [Arthrobacter oryzae]